MSLVASFDSWDAILRAHMANLIKFCVFAGIQDIYNVNLAAYLSCRDGFHF